MNASPCVRADGHRVWVAGTLHICRRCGAFAEYRAFRLKGPCRGRPSRHGRDAIRRVFECGQHPKKAVELPPPIFWARQISAFPVAPDAQRPGRRAGPRQECDVRGRSYSDVVHDLLGLCDDGMVSDLHGASRLRHLQRREELGDGRRYHDAVGGADAAGDDEFFLEFEEGPVDLGDVAEELDDFQAEEGFFIGAGLDDGEATTGPPPPPYRERNAKRRRLRSKQACLVFDPPGQAPRKRVRLRTKQSCPAGLQ